MFLSGPCLDLCVLFDWIDPGVASKAGHRQGLSPKKGERASLGQRWNVLGCYWSEGTSLSASALVGCPGEGVCGGCETGARGWAMGSVPATMPSTPAPAPGRAPGVTPIRPAGNLGGTDVQILNNFCGQI